MYMNRDDAKEYAITQGPDFLESAGRVGYQHSYVCPFCGNGSGRSGTGITPVPGTDEHKMFHCFKCGENADIFALAKKYFGCASLSQAFDIVYRELGILIDADYKVKHAYSYSSKRNECQFFKVLFKILLVHFVYFLSKKYITSTSKHRKNSEFLKVFAK